MISGRGVTNDLVSITVVKFKLLDIIIMIVRSIIVSLKLNTGFGDLRYGRSVRIPSSDGNVKLILT